MNITYIIGNGFDLFNEFKTSYNDYSNYLKNNSNKYPDISDIIESINKFKSGNSQINWSDFEEGLLEYFNTSSITNVNVVKMKINLCINSLIDYLIIENKKLKNYKLDLKNSNDFYYPYNACELEDKITIIKRFNAKNQNDVINIISLNYTDICNVYFKDTGCNVINLHGRLNTSLTVLGADNNGQLSKSKWNESDISALSEYFCKNYMIREYLTETYNEFGRFLLKTDLFVIFGTSMGVTDESLWKSIGRSMSDNGSLLIYSSYKEYVNPSKTVEYIDFIKGKRRMLCDKLSLNEKFSKNIFIAKSEKIFTKKLSTIELPKIQYIKNI